SNGGDVNGDNIPDFITSANRANVGGLLRSGIVYWMFGGSGAFLNPVNLNSLQGNIGAILNGTTSSSTLGYVVKNAKNFGGDQKDDTLITAPNASPGGLLQAGQFVVIFGIIPGLDALNGTNGFSANGLLAGDQLGAGASGLGDLNGDGIPDIGAGAPQ
ncbi:hypothetical protein OEZ74_26035, partial [Leclercia adecarboxylata]|uniref:hypothetical protein n=1 Tax=Leclercia adecarboxylata TaxID=83655 RepID=UPI00234D08DC